MFALIPNLTRDNAKEVTISVCEKLKELGAEFSLSTENSCEFSCFNNEVFCEENDLIKNSDCIITIGGDGTIIRSAKLAAKHSKPILGINAGRVAFMAGLEKQELNLLQRLMDKDYKIDKRIMLDVEIVADDKVIYSFNCINDAVVARGQHIKMVEFEVKCNGNLLNDYFADGMIFATPTGSTAYSLSAGGPVIEPVIESIMMTPICTHTLFSRSMIFKSDSIFEINGKKGSELYLSCDGDENVKIPEGSTVIIKKAEKTADFIRIKADTFIDILNDKLVQRRL